MGNAFLRSCGHNNCCGNNHMDRTSRRKTYWEEAGGFLVAEIYLSEDGRLRICGLLRTISFSV